ncbi:hypothetical protein GQ55_4G241700 [Panicum hallii var. hallii]|uniref:Uncharacterized protein n=1 Tax=Panicum hallii var. hallii TaxID=1504633 RepID=A0A2T7DZS5_9POAL|nr:hypothetical protein GQ55_4G241700 [Panicum hallii var. hallii]
MVRLPWHHRSSPMVLCPGLTTPPCPRGAPHVAGALRRVLVGVPKLVALHGVGGGAAAVAIPRAMGSSPRPPTYGRGLGSRVLGLSAGHIGGWRRVGSCMGPTLRLMGGYVVAYCRRRAHAAVAHRAARDRVVVEEVGAIGEGARQATRRGREGRSGLKSKI